MELLMILIGWVSTSMFSVVAFKSQYHPIVKIVMYFTSFVLFALTSSILASSSYDKYVKAINPFY